MIRAIKFTDPKRFGELVDSPYFNKNERVKRLWKWLMEKYITAPQSPLLKGKGGSKQNFFFTKEELEEAVRMDPSSGEADQGLKPANFRMVLSDFVKLAEIFLLTEGIDITAEQNEKLMEIFKEKGLIKSYNKQLRLLKLKTGKEDSKDITYYNNLYLIECEELVSGKPKDRQKRLRNINSLTDFIWVCMKLDGFIKSFAFGAEIRSMTFYNEITDLIENDKEGYKKDHSVIYSRYLILKMFEQKSFTDNPYFTELEKYIAKLKSHELIKYNYDALLAYCRMNEEFEWETVLMKKLERKKLKMIETI